MLQDEIDGKKRGLRSGISPRTRAGLRLSRRWTKAAGIVEEAPAAEGEAEEKSGGVEAFQLEPELVVEEDVAVELWDSVARAEEDDDRNGGSRR
jgi:hypothetical protein